MQRGSNLQTNAAWLQPPDICFGARALILRLCVYVCAHVCACFVCVFFFLCVQADRDGFRGMKADAQERNIKARPRPLFDVVDSHKVLWCLVLLTTNY